ncbi:MAG: hypothetical protein ACRDS0_38400 [Pseudonocardiaceae bacterium]
MTEKISLNGSDDLSILTEVVTDLACRAGILDLLLASSRHEELADDRVTLDLDAVAWETAKRAVAIPRPPLERARLTLVRLAASERT